jgi:hypothetical protein
VRDFIAGIRARRSAEIGMSSVVAGFSNLSNAMRAGLPAVPEERGVHAAVPDGDLHRRVVASLRKRDVPGGPDVGLVDLVGSEIRRVGLGQCLLERQPRDQRVAGADDAGREVGTEDPPGLVDDGLQAVADVAQDERLADDLGGGLGALDVVLDHGEGHLRQFGRDEAPHFRAIGLGGDAARLRLRRHRGLQQHSGQELVRGLLLERADVGGALGRLGVAALEEVDLHEHAHQRALRGLVGDLVAVEDGLVVAAHLGGELAERGLAAHEVLELALDLVGEARHVGRLLDALLALRERGGGDGRRQDDECDSLQHG